MGFGFVALVTGGCNVVPKDGSKSSDDEEEGDEGADTADAPVWINATYLTCDWGRIASQSEAGISCAVKRDDGQEIVKDDSVKFVWTVIDALGGEIDPQKLEDSGGKVDFVLLAKLIAGGVAKLEISGDGFSTVIEALFDKTLRGLGDGPLAACFAGESAVIDCFRLAGIDLQVGDVFGDNGEGKVSEACKDPSKLPEGVQCEMGSDAVAGDLDFARKWYRYGQDLLKPDGSVNAEEFCDENGVKETSSRGKIERGVRWQSYFDVGKLPCFDKFEPHESVEAPDADHPFFGKHVVYDAEHGVDGEPYCYFVIMNTATVFGEEVGGFDRMLIIKNPRIFGNSANGKKLTLEALEATANHFGCVEK